MSFLQGTEYSHHYPRRCRSTRVAAAGTGRAGASPPACSRGSARSPDARLFSGEWPCHSTCARVAGSVSMVAARVFGASAGDLEFASVHLDGEAVLTPGAARSGLRGRVRGAGRTASSARSRWRRGRCRHRQAGREQRCPQRPRLGRGLELVTAVGQLVHPGRGRRCEGAPPHDPGLLELSQALGKHVGTEVSKARAKVGEALGTGPRGARGPPGVPSARPRHPVRGRSRSGRDSCANGPSTQSTD